MRAEELKGHLDALLLATLEDGPRHGYAVMEALRRSTDGRLDLPTGTIYPALHRLERRGWISSSWGTSQNNRRAKYYRLTRTGRKQLFAETSKWERLTAAIGRVMNPVKSEE